MKIQNNILEVHYHKIGGNTKKDGYTYYKQNAFIMPPAYKTNLQLKTHNSNFAV